MTAEDPTQIREVEAHSHRLTALRAAFLVASHHGVALRPEYLPTLTDGDMTDSVIAALTRSGFRARLVQGSTWATAAELGTTYPSLVPMAAGRWVILVLVVT